MTQGFDTPDLVVNYPQGLSTDTPILMSILMSYPHDVDHIAFSRSSYPHDLDHIGKLSTMSVLSYLLVSRLSVVGARILVLEKLIKVINKERNSNEFTKK
jgi:hypothetical protein